MNVIETSLPGVLLIEPKVFEDDRGFFMETFNAPRFADAGLPTEFVQDNHSHSVRGVLRGIHYQEPNAQGKLIRAVTGKILDVAVDIRRGSPWFGKWVGYELSAENHRMLWVPAGFGHGYYTLSEFADVLYRCTALYDPPSDRAIRWDDPEIAVEWGASEPIVSPRDGRAPRLGEAEVLPAYQG